KGISAKCQTRLHQKKARPSASNASNAKSWRGTILMKSVNLRALGALRFRPSGSGPISVPGGFSRKGTGPAESGGRTAEGKSSEFFMVRIRIPNGILSSDQVRTLADLSENHARGLADITVRQNLQLHWVKIESIPEIIESLQRAGLTTTGACGDVVRTVTGCPVAGLAHDEHIDASPWALAVDGALGGNREFYNLPRKFKITVTRCRTWCSYPEINDVAFTATRRIRGSNVEHGFSVRIGGGLSTEPHLALKLNAFVRQDQVVDVARGIG